MSRPTNARMPPRRPRGRVSVSARSSLRALTGCDFPLAATWNASPSANAPPTASAVRSPTTISPGAAACSSLAATLTASPVTNELPSRARPVTTSPVFTPIRSASASPKSSVSRCLHRERGVQRALGVILVRLGHPEGGHDRVARVLLHGAAGSLDLGGHRVVEPLEQEPRPLGILLLAERGRADEVGEEHGCQLALGLHAAILTRLARGPAEIHRHRGAGERAPAWAEQELDHSRHLVGLDQPLHRVRREDHVRQHAVLGQTVRLAPATRSEPRRAASARRRDTLRWRGSRAPRPRARAP